MTTPRPLPRYRWDIVVGQAHSFRDRLTPAQLFVGSFAVLVLVGTLGFKLLPGLYTAAPLSWLDALLMSTSAVCVTGLTVIDVGAALTVWGQAWLLLLIQLGGLGVITFASLIMLVLGGRLSLRQEAVATSSLDAPAPVAPRRLLLDILVFTLSIEAVAAVLLLLLWWPEMGVQAAWPAVFHSVSAFCNAGFSTFSDALIGRRDNPPVLLIIQFLIVAGGLGFLTLEELTLRLRPGRTQRLLRMSLHSQLVLITTAVLILGGAVLLGALEWERTLAGLSWYDRVVNAFFLSITPRTAGFNTINYTQAADSSNFLTILLMTVGGSPGSTAGGLKTTTLALVGLLAWSRFRGQSVTSVRGRSLRNELLGRAIGLCVVAFTVVIAGVLVLTLSEEGRGLPGGFLGLLFEAASAFNTVGLSMDLTPRLSATGKGVVIALMFLGRVGTLTFAAAIALRPGEAGKFRFAYEDVVVG